MAGGPLHEPGQGHMLASTSTIRLNSSNMDRKWLLWIAFLLILVGCQDVQGNLKGPSKVGTPAPLVAPFKEPVQVNIRTLLANPAAYEGQLIQARGQFRPLQPLSCEGKLYESPATWALAEGERELPAAGPADQLPALASDELTLTVIGRWQRWRGLIGCGQLAMPGERWYLAASRIASPETLALAEGSVASETGLPSPGGEAGQEASGALVVETPQQLGQDSAIVVNPNAPQPSAAINATAYPGPGGFLNPASGGTRTPVPTATPTAVSLSSFPSRTPPPGTAAPNPRDLDDANTRATIDLGSLETSRLEPGETDRWPYQVTSPQVIKVQIGPEPDLNLAISVQDATGRVLANGATGQPGRPVILQNINLSQAGAYEVLVSAQGGSRGDYAILITDEESYQFIFRGTLPDDDTVSGEIEPESDHIWQFKGKDNETISITGSPSENKDLFFRLFGPDGRLLIDLSDESPAGETETLANYTLPADGLYSLVVGEVDFGATEYLLEFVRP